jgi:hypothetical protein
MSYDSDMEYLDGPGFAAWLEETLELGELSRTYPALHRRLSGWRNGESATIWSADKFLITFGHHPIEIPDRLFKPNQRKTNKIENTGQGRLSPKVREEALSLVDQGERPADVARKLNITDRSIRRWKAKRAEELAAAEELAVA